MASPKATALARRGMKMKDPTSPPQQASKPPAPQAGSDPDELNYTYRVDSYMLFEVATGVGAYQQIRLDGYTAKAKDDGTIINNYSYTRTFEEAPIIGTPASIAESLANAFLKKSGNLKDQIHNAIEKVKGLPGIGDLADLPIKLTDLTYKTNVKEGGKVQNYLQFGLGFAPRNGWSIGELKITGFGFKYTHNLTPAASTAGTSNPPADS